MAQPLCCRLVLLSMWTIACDSRLLSNLWPVTLRAGQPVVQLYWTNRANLTCVFACRSWAIIFSVLALGTTFLPTFSNYRSAAA